MGMYTRNYSDSPGFTKKLQSGDGEAPTAHCLHAAASGQPEAAATAVEVRAHTDTGACEPERGKHFLLPSAPSALPCCPLCPVLVAMRRVGVATCCLSAMLSVAELVQTPAHLRSHHNDKIFLGT